MKAIVIGAGFAGACTAWLLRERLGAEITILEQDHVPGGMLRTSYTAEGLPYEYGPRVVSVFRGTPGILPFLRRFLKLEERRIYQGTRLRPDWPVIPFPVDRASVGRLPCGEQVARELAEIAAAGREPSDESLEAYLRTSVGPTLTSLAFAGFNLKFWGRRLRDMPAEWGKLRRLDRIAETGDFRLPSEAPHHYPRGGFNSLFDQLLEGFDVRYGSPAIRVASNGGGVTVASDGATLHADLVVATAPIDALLGYRFGPLEWRGYRVETEVAPEPARAELGRAPDGVPFAWLYTPWAETPVCRTTDFGAIHQGEARPGPSVVLREIVDDKVRMYPVWWEDEKFYRYLAEATRIPGLVPLGRLGLYKYVTMDSTLAMAERLLDGLERFLGASAAERFEIARHVRGDWSN
ncbi:MAG: FAD-dependent oxidoreductase [Thermodesulfobacteriota bacterium]